MTRKNLTSGRSWHDMREITTELKIDKSGRIVIPEIYRLELKIQPGQLVKITISNPLEKDD
ncbi:Uncharacterised protein [uncultured archaeon]|nr:Uncharacterised protein [uncultured archaeon]